jgi:hypothetical protein
VAIFLLWSCQPTELHVPERGERDRKRAEHDANIGEHIILFIHAMIHVFGQLYSSPSGLLRQLLGTRPGPSAPPLRSTRHFLNARRGPVSPS